MNRYHSKVYFPQGASEALQDFTDENNCQNWGYTTHCLDNIMHRAIDNRALLEFIKAQELKAQDIFEYYAEGERIVKACYRINWQSGLDIILVVNALREIITIYINTADDEHVTLDANLYTKPL